MNKFNLKLIYFFIFTCTMLFNYSACKIDDFSDLNGPSVQGILENATIGEIQNLVTGAEAAMRDRLGTYYDGVSMIGRDYWRFSAADPRFTADLLGKGSATLDNNTFYTTQPFAARYRVIKTLNILNQSAQQSKHLNDEQKKGVSGLVNTLKAHQLLMVLNQQYNNGIRVDVDDPDNLGSFLSKDESLNAIYALLAQGKTDLEAAGNEFAFSLSSGFDSFNTPQTFAKFNRALSARVAIYKGDANAAKLDLSNSFFSLDGSLSTGVYHIFSAAGGDVLNEVAFPPNSIGEVRVAHPSFIADAEAGDTRLNKTFLRTDAATLDGLSGNYDVYLYKSSSAPICIIRNEELILISAEAENLLGNSNDAIMAINKIRNAAGLSNYSGGTLQSEITEEILKQRRYSLFAEGHRWVDMRRYNKLSELTIDRENDDVFEQFPHPLTEGN